MQEKFCNIANIMQIIGEYISFTYRIWLCDMYARQFLKDDLETIQRDKTATDFLDLGQFRHFRGVIF